MGRRGGGVSLTLGERGLDPSGKVRIRVTGSRTGAVGRQSRGSRRASHRAGRWPGPDRAPGLVFQSRPVSGPWVLRVSCLGFPHSAGSCLVALTLSAPGAWASARASFFPQCLAGCQEQRRLGHVSYMAKGQARSWYSPYASKCQCRARVWIVKCPHHQHRQPPGGGCVSSLVTAPWLLGTVCLSPAFSVCACVHPSVSRVLTSQ